MKSASLQTWSLLASPRVRAAEISGPAISLRALPVVLAGVAAMDLKNAAFLIVRIDSFVHSEFQGIARRVLISHVGPRICLAVNRSAMKVAASEDLGAIDVGLMLDDVDADTPLSDLAFDALEAIRFRPEFVAAASSNLRLGFALDAMLAFSRDAGLCTLGPAKETAGFDYVPSSLTDTLTPSLRRTAQADERMQPAE